VPLAEFTFGDALLTVFEIFLFVVYFWILITIFSDLKDKGAITQEEFDRHKAKLLA
jgi:hypothetical protein